MFSWLFGNSSAAGKAMDAVINTGDALVFTDEEKSVANQKILDWKIEYAKNTQNQSVSRRIITVAVCLLWVCVGIAALIAQALGATEFAKYSLKFLTDVVMQPFSIIIAFYFLSHVVGNAKK